MSLNNSNEFKDELHEALLFGLDNPINLPRAKSFPQDKMIYLSTPSGKTDHIQQLFNETKGEIS